MASCYWRMQTTQADLKAQIAALLQKAANTDEVEKDEPELDIPAEIERRTARLAAVEAAKARLEVRHRQSDAARGRTPDDARKPKDKVGKPKGGKHYQRDFGVPAAKAQDSFTAPDSRVMKRAGGGFDYAYNAQTAVDETAQIIVAAEVVNTSSDVQQLPMVLKAVKAHAGAQAAHMLADAGYRSEAVIAELAQTQPDTQQNGGNTNKLRGKGPEKHGFDTPDRISQSTATQQAGVDEWTHHRPGGAGGLTAMSGLAEIILPPRLLVAI